MHLVDLLAVLSARVHDDGPEVVAGGHTGHKQAVLPALLDVHEEPACAHIVVVALLHGLCPRVHRDPLRGVKDMRRGKECI